METTNNSVLHKVNNKVRLQVARQVLSGIETGPGLIPNKQLIKLLNIIVDIEEEIYVR